MTEQRQLRITNGPNKPELLYSLVYPQRRHNVHFETDDDAFDARIDEMEELEDGFSFVLKGSLTSGLHKGVPFEAIYSVGTRSGELGLPRFAD